MPKFFLNLLCELDNNAKDIMLYIMENKHFSIKSIRRSKLKGENKRKSYQNLNSKAFEDAMYELANVKVFLCIMYV